MTIVALMLVAINAITIAMFWIDKQRAIGGRRRIPEKELLGMALIGGAPGALLARSWFRHKTRKEPFSTQLLVIAVVQAGVVAGWFVI